MKYFDLHCDTITECFVKETELYDNTLQWSLKNAAGIHPLAQVFAIWIPDDLRGAAAEQRFDDVYATFLRETGKNGGAIGFCTTAAQLRDTLQNKKAAALLSIEGGAALGGKIENLDRAFEKGVRILTLTWNGRCETADGVMEKDARGLTPFGVEVVRRMERLGMLVDVSHLSEKGFWDVAGQSDAPFIATHSNAKAVCAHRRNLSDEQFREIVRRRGLVGINLYRNFLRDDGNAYIKDVTAHVAHFLSLGGKNVLAMGGDLDGSDLPHDMRGVEDAEKIYDTLRESFGEKTADAIFFDNAQRFFEEFL